MAIIAGKCYIKVNGTQFNLRGNMTISIGNEEKEPIVGLDKFHGLKVVPRASFLECDITDTADLDVEALENIQDATITVELVNGKTAVLRNAFQTNALELKAEDGVMTVKFQAPKGEWIKV